jgi:hypothetical protein
MRRGEKREKPRLPGTILISISNESGTVCSSWCRANNDTSTATFSSL